MTDEQFKGHNGQVRIDGDWLIIDRKGLGRLGHSKGDRRIPLANITAVQMRPAGALANGFIRFTVPGSPDLRGGLKNAASDENAIIYRKSQQEAFDRLRSLVEGYLTARLAGSARAAAPTSMTDELGKLAALRDQGVLDDAEFAAAKARLLGGGND